MRSGITARGPACKRKEMFERGRRRTQSVTLSTATFSPYYLTGCDFIHDGGGTSRSPHGITRPPHMNYRYPPTWFTSCMCPVMRATCCLLADGCHRNMVKSSEPETMRSGWPAVAVWYLQGGEGGRS